MKSLSAGLVASARAHMRNTPRLCADPRRGKGKGGRALKARSPRMARRPLPTRIDPDPPRRGHGASGAGPARLAFDPLQGATDRTSDSDRGRRGDDISWRQPQKIARKGSIMSTVVRIANRANREAPKSDDLRRGQIARLSIKSRIARIVD